MTEPHIVIEELTLRRVGDKDAEPLDIKPLRVTVDGKTLPLVWDARDIKAIEEDIARESS